LNEAFDNSNACWQEYAAIPNVTLNVTRFKKQGKYPPAKAFYGPYARGLGMGMGLNSLSLSSIK
jgi:hypothetical protein